MSVFNYSNVVKFFNALQDEPPLQVLNNTYRRLVNRSYAYTSDIVVNQEKVGDISVHQAYLLDDKVIYINSTIVLKNDAPLSYDISLGPRTIDVGTLSSSTNRINVILPMAGLDHQGAFSIPELGVSFPIYLNTHAQLYQIEYNHLSSVFKLLNPTYFEQHANMNGQINSTCDAPATITQISEDLSHEEVTIIIPTKDSVHLLRACIKSILAHTHQAFRIIIINNSSEEKKTLDYFSRVISDNRISVFDYPYPFNYAGMHNAIMKEVKTDYICLLNNDIEIKTTDWLSNMLMNFEQEDVGAVGCRLLYPDGRVQHDGIYANLSASFNYVDHINVGLRTTDPLFYNMGARIYTMGVTAACMLTKKSTFTLQGGFDEENFPISFNDVDYCLNLLKSHQKVILHTDISHVHHESVSRNIDSKALSVEKKSFRRLMKKWRPFLNSLQGYPMSLSLIHI